MSLQTPFFDQANRNLACLHQSRLTHRGSFDDEEEEMGHQQPKTQPLEEEIKMKKGKCHKLHPRASHAKTLK